MRLLADMAGLSTVRVVNVYYVTTDEGAKRLRAERWRRPPVPPPELTLKVTGTTEVSPLALTVMVPLKVPAARPLTLEATVNVAGVVPVAGETVSHDPLLTLAVNAVLGLAVSDSDCEAGETPPAVALNESKVGLTLSVDAGLTVNVTGTLTVCPLPVTVMVAVKVPADSPLTLDDTVNVAGVVPVDGEMVSHDAPLTLAV